jgi:hypothetical protein
MLGRQIPIVADPWHGRKPRLLAVGQEHLHRVTTVGDRTTVPHGRKRSTRWSRG